MEKRRLLSLQSISVIIVIISVSRCSSVATTKLDKNAAMDELSMENPGESFYLTVEVDALTN